MVYCGSWRAGRHHGDLHGVVVAVVAALDLNDQVAAGEGTHEVDRDHGGLGAGVGEPPLRQAAPAGQFGGDDDGVGGRLGEMGAARDLVADGADDGRVRVAGQRGTVPAVQVDVLVA